MQLERLYHDRGLKYERTTFRNMKVKPQEEKKHFDANDLAND